MSIALDGQRYRVNEGDALSSGSGSEEDTLENCPTVENITRHISTRDEMVKEVFDKIIRLVVDQLAVAGSNKARLRSLIEPLNRDQEQDRCSIRERVN